ncbi:hypothetical protein [Ensifer sp. MJa1]|uniref:hypothetical protein n=1 Tax=Ensifer sp. MJa1 TaxID=2919888 RepID=UPI0030081202
MPSSSPDALPIDRIFAVSDAIRYVALYRKGELILRQKPQLAGASAAESDKYEELLVNPTLLKLARQRGDIDCGGARFVLVGYGNFHQLVIDLPDGHVSVCFELGSQPLDHWQVIRDVALASG